MLIQTKLKYFNSRGQNDTGDKNTAVAFPIELIHLITGYVLIISGIFAYFSGGLEMFLAWAIFGCMYISMSDIGECTKCSDELCSLRHKNRRIIAFIGMAFSITLLAYYIISFL